MPNWVRRSLAVMLIGCLAPLGGVYAQDEPSTGEQLASEYVARFADGGMERWQEAMAPGKAHQFLAEKLVGQWRTTAHIISGGQEGPALNWTAQARPILGGRYIEHISSGEMMGMAVESRMIIGYDNVRRLFHTTMFDTMNTGVRTLWGNIDKDGDTLTFVGGMDEPMTGEVGKPVLISWTFNEDGTNEYVIKEILYGEPFAVVRAHSERVDEGGDGAQGANNDPPGPAPGPQIAWLDLTVEHATAVAAFYEKVIGLERQPVDMGGYNDFNMVREGAARPVGGVCHARGANAALPPVWLPYFTVEDIDRALTAAESLGGAVIDGPRPVGRDRMAVIRDPAGACCALYWRAGAEAGR